ncbi:MAG: J domain-containing protein [Thermonemataceae bacterium]|mgnify:CR=1 FL=1
MITEKLWRLIKAYINDTIDSILEERGFGEDKYQDPGDDWEERYRKYKSGEKNHDDFYKSYERYKQYYQQSKGYGGYQREQYGGTKNDLDAKYYKYLEVPYGASFDVIKKAYKEQMKKYHPDKFYNNEKKREAAQKLSKKLNEAYQHFSKKFGKK